MSIAYKMCGKPMGKTLFLVLFLSACAQFTFTTSGTWNYEDYDYENYTEIGASAELTGDTVGPKVLDGTEANPGDFPHQVLLYITKGDGTRSICGASIIHPLLLLTAAHCVFENVDPAGIEAIAGEHNQKEREDSEQKLAVIVIILHKKLNTTTWDNDITILALKNPVTFDNFVKPIKIPESNQELPDIATVSGWGRARTTSFSTSDVLRSAQVNFTDFQTCKKMWAEGRKPKNVTENMICSGDKNKDACQGDSGGPLTCKNDQTGESYLCGVVSFGTVCNTAHKRRANPGLYTDVRRYYSWIWKHKRAYWKHYYFSPLAQPIMTSLDGSDGNCGQDRFECEKSELCLPPSFKCDGENDCAPWDDSDENEVNCPGIIKCSQNKFACADGRQCVRQSFHCDGEDDCRDNSDELNCSSES